MTLPALVGEHVLRIQEAHMLLWPTMIYLFILSSGRVDNALLPSVPTGSSGSAPTESQPRHDPFQAFRLCRRFDTGSGCFIFDLWAVLVRRSGDISGDVVQLIL